MFTATLLALGTRLVKFQISNFGFQACLSLISTQIFNFKHPWAHLMLNCSIFKAKLAKTDIFTKVEKWNFTSLVLRARSVAVNIFSKCHGTDEWTLIDNQCHILAFACLYDWKCLFLHYEVRIDLGHAQEFIFISLRWISCCVDFVNAENWRKVALVNYAKSCYLTLCVAWKLALLEMLHKILFCFISCLF